MTAGSPGTVLPLPLVSPHALRTESATHRPHMSLVDLTVEIPSSTVPPAKQRPPRWATFEFKIYWTVLAIMLPIMAWIPISLSSPSNPNYIAFANKLSDGWILNRQVDNSDVQYRSFRNNVPVLVVVAAVFLLLKYLWTCSRLSYSRLTSNNLHLIPFNVLFSLLFLAGLHGSSTFKILFILTVNYLIAKKCAGTKMGPFMTWTFNIAILFLNDRYDGYSFGQVLPPLEFLDSYEGFYPRWYISFNITMLRLISFNMDCHWAQCDGVSSESNNVGLGEKQRQIKSHPEAMYSFANYIAYVLYAPLYIAGPIMTFNDFLWQHRQSQPISRRVILGYTGRFLMSFLTMEFILHFMYVVAIKDRKAWYGNTPAQISMIGFWNLIIVWLKLLIPWRFFRLWALTDGIDPPENMVRCMANNYSTTGFWRSWHRSYNLWIIRYIYIPLGGAKRVFLNTVVVFSFVALWHDLTFRLLAWGWLVSLFIIPELVATYFLPASLYDSAPWYRHVCAVGAVFNILLMMAANLVGFVVGLDGLEYFGKQVFGTFAGIQFLTTAFFSLFVGAQLMFEYREEEMRQGIYRRC